MGRSRGYVGNPNRRSGWRQCALAFELFQNALSIADEMALTIMHHLSGVLKDNMDLLHCPGRRRRQGGGQGSDAPRPSRLDPRRWSRSAASSGTIWGGDIFIMNDPFDGGMHLPDSLRHQTAVCRRQARRLRLQFVTIPMSGVGPGRFPDHGGLCRRPHRTDEDVSGGKRNDTLPPIEKNVRVPVKVFGGLRAQLATAIPSVIPGTGRALQCGDRNLYMQGSHRLCQALDARAIPSCLRVSSLRRLDR